MDPENSNDPFFKILVRLLMETKAKEVRKKIIKSLNIEDDETTLMLVSPFLLDLEPDVRITALQKLIAKKLNYGDLNGKFGPMVVLNEALNETGVLLSFGE